MDCITKYAILTRQTLLREYSSSQVPLDNNGRGLKTGSITVDAGTLVKVFQTVAAGDTKSIVQGSVSNIQVLDFERKNPIFENLYQCPRANLCKVSEDLWPYVISIADKVRRLSFVRNQSNGSWVIYLKINDLVSVSGEMFGMKALRYDCIIRYIGPVQELSPVGYFFGLELLHLESGYSPQSEGVPFSIKYMQCDPSLSIFVTADRIAPLPSEVKKKFSALDLLSGTLEKVRRTVINPGNCLNNINDGANSLNTRKEKKPSKHKEATAQFYTANSETPSYNMERKQQRASNPPDPMTHSLNDLASDEFKQSIENYERSLERQHVGNKVQSSQVAPTGILKHRHTSASTTGSTSGANIDLGDTLSKPVTILSLEDRDIVVIDKADIRESTKNEGSIIVVDKQRQQEVDLADLLGNNWPQTAGDAAVILNQTTKPQEQQLNPVGGINSSGGGGGVGGGGGSSNSSVSSLSQHKTSDRNISPHLPVDLSTSSRHRETSKVDYNNIAEHERSDAVKTKSFEKVQHKAPPYDNLIFDASASEASYAQNSPLLEIPHTGLDVGSMVEVSISEAFEDLYGVIRWVGVPPGAKGVMVGVELEDEPRDKQLLTTDGSFNSVPLFKCPEGRALFVTPDLCAKDKRFLDVEGAVNNKSISSVHDTKMFGQMECPSVPGAVAPLKILNLEELEDICGKFKGIQGHHNSCYLDATLFSMFTFTSVFDSLLFRAPDAEDISQYIKVQKVLREEIVNPLRKNLFVRADRIMKLRQLLDKLSSVSGLMSEEKDPEEFLNSLLAQIMRVEPFLKLSSGQDAFFYQLFVEKDERLSFPSVQQLFEQSFHSSDIKLKEVPSCLIIQMPRFGKNYKMYPRILPSQVLDVTDIIEDSPRQCSVCGKLAEYECRDCFGILQSGFDLESTAFCRNCLETVHMHTKRANHTSKKLSVPQDFRIMAEHMTVPRLYMELFAVVCIETSHYVTFVKAGSGPDSPWCFFDSMADRKGEQNGYNIPEMRTVPDMPGWLSEEGARVVNETSSNDKMLPEHAKRLFCDAYMCMYQSTDVMMYR